MKNKILWIAIVLCLLTSVLFFSCGNKNEEEIETPEIYKLKVDKIYKVYEVSIHGKPYYSYFQINKDNEIKLLYVPVRRTVITNIDNSNEACIKYYDAYAELCIPESCIDQGGTHYDL